MLLQILLKSQFRAAVLRDSKASIDVERQKSKNITSSQVLNASVVNETLTLCLECSRKYMKFVCERLSVHNLWKSDLVKGLASFDYSVLILLPKEHSASCYGCVFNSFSATVGWIEN